jgi:thiol-disulfide isomerase/thioredoxin
MWRSFVAVFFSIGLAHAEAPSQTFSTEALFGSTFTSLANQSHAMSQWKGRPLIVNFWARWCGPCRTEIPDLVKVHQRFKSRGLVVLGIAIEDNVDGVREFAKSNEMEYPIYLAKDKGVEVMRALGNTRMGLPFSVIVDRSGKITMSRLGVLKGDELSIAAEVVLK